MPPLSAAIINKYFANAGDIELPTGEVVPNTSSLNNVSYFIDGHNYFAAIRAEMSRLLTGGSNRFFYFTDWWLGLVPLKIKANVPAAEKTGSAWDGFILSEKEDFDSPAFILDDGSGVAHPPFIDELESMSRVGIDVRAFAWVIPQLLDYEMAAKQQTGFWVINLQSLKSVAELRSRTNMQNKAVLNTLAHPLGSMHMKMVICGDDTQICAFIGGIDLTPGKASDRAHSIPSHKWHDAAARVEGPATNGIYDYFRQLWNEQIARPPLLFRISDGVTNKRVPTHVIDKATMALQDLPDQPLDVVPLA